MIFNPNQVEGQFPNVAPFPSDLHVNALIDEGTMFR